MDSINRLTKDYGSAILTTSNEKDVLSMSNAKAILKKDYVLLGCIDDEIDALTSFTNDYSGGEYIGDVIAEIADAQIPIYTHDIWKNIYEIKEYIEEAISSGLVSLDGNVDLDKVFQVGYYQFYTQSLYNNLDSMVYNMMVERVNTFLSDFINGDSEGVDLNLIEDAIEDKSSNYDNNNTFDVIEEDVEEIIQSIKDGEYNE